MPTNIALLGAAGSGKDTVADRLTSAHRYMRLAFADPLKELALEADPLIPTEQGNEGRIHVRLSNLVRDYGWDLAKSEYPEIRRTLQKLGEGVRNIDSEFWITQLLTKLLITSTLGVPVVITDVRYMNEAEMLTRCGLTLVRIVRPGLDDGEAFRSHASETELANYPTHHTIINDGPLSYLFKQVETLTA